MWSIKVSNALTSFWVLNTRFFFFYLFILPEVGKIRFHQTLTFCREILQIVGQVICESIRTIKVRLMLALHFRDNLEIHKLIHLRIRDSRTRNDIKVRRTLLSNSIHGDEKKRCVVILRPA